MGSCSNRRVSLRRGFWRLTLVLWLLGTGAILTLFVGFADPFANLCILPGAEDVVKCLGETVAPSKGSAYDDMIAGLDAMTSVHHATNEAKANGTTVEEELRKEGRNADGQKLAVDASKVVRRWTTDAYRSNVRLALAYLAGWTALTWGPFYLIAWVAGGFASPTR